jgi:hypothetical protein
LRDMPLASEINILTGGLGCGLAVTWLVLFAFTTSEYRPA